MIRPLGSIERALLYADQNTPANLISAIQFRGHLAHQTLESALRLLYMHYPLLGARICWETKHPFFETVAEPRDILQVLPRQDDMHWFTIAQEVYDQRIDITHDPLFKCIYLAPEQGSSECAEIILRFHHTIADAATVDAFWHSLLGLCERIAQGEAISSLDPLPVPPAVEMQFPPDYKGARRMGKIFQYAASQMSKEILYRWHARKKRIPALLENSQVKLLTMQTPQSLSTRLAFRARHEGVTLPSLLNCAMLLAVDRWIYSGQKNPMHTFVFSDLRPYTQPPLGAHNLSCAFALLRYTLDVDPNQGIWQLTRELNHQVYLSLRRGDRFSANLMTESLIKMVTHYKLFRLGTAALSFSKITALKEIYGSIQVKGVYGFAPIIDAGPEYSAVCTFFADTLWWGVTYQTGDMGASMAQCIADEVQAILAAALNE